MYCLRGCPAGVDDDSSEGMNLAGDPAWASARDQLVRRLEAIEASGDLLPAGGGRGQSSRGATAAAVAAGGWTPWL